MKENYTQKRIVSYLMGLDGVQVEFGKTVIVTGTSISDEKIKILVSKTELIVKIENETIIIPFENLTEVYQWGNNYDNKITIESKNTKLEVKIKIETKEEEKEEE